MLSAEAKQTMILSRQHKMTRAIGAKNEQFRSRTRSQILKLSF